MRLNPSYRRTANSQGCPPRETLKSLLIKPTRPGANAKLYCSALAAKLNKAGRFAEANGERLTIEDDAPLDVLAIVCLRSWPVVVVWPCGREVRGFDSHVHAI